MAGRQGAGLLRLLAMLAIFLGLVAMHHLSLAQCDDTLHSDSVAAVSVHHDASSMMTSHADSASTAEGHAHTNLLVGCGCMLAVCLAILALLVLIRPRALRQRLRMRQRIPRSITSVFHIRPFAPPDLYALSVLRT